MKKKRLAIGLLALSACFGLASCKDEEKNPPIVETEGYTITFNANGHGTAPSSISDAKTIPTLTELTESGWTFGGWYKDSACTEKAEAGTALTEDITLYAKWTENVAPEVKYSITYEINGHGVQPSAESEVTALPAALPELTAEGWTFDGWYTDELCTIAAVAGATITENTTLYAKWTENVQETFNVYFHLTATDTPTPVEVEKEGLVDEPATPTLPYKEFTHWYTSPTEQTEDTLFSFSTPIMEETHLYAGWIAETENVTYAMDYDAALTAAGGSGSSYKLVEDKTFGKFTFGAGVYFETRTSTPAGQCVNNQGKTISFTLSGNATFSCKAYGASSSGCTMTLSKADGTVIKAYDKLASNALLEISETLEAGDYVLASSGSARIFELQVVETVEKSAPSGITLSGYTTKFLQGRDIDVSSLAVTLNYENGRKDVLTAGAYQVDTTAFDKTTAGTYEIKVTYGDFEQTFDVYVYAVESIELYDYSLNASRVTLPLQKVFLVNGTFNADNLAVHAIAKTPDKAETEDFLLTAAEYQVSTPDLTQTGAKVVTVTEKISAANAKSGTYNVEVVNNVFTEADSYVINVDANAEVSVTSEGVTFKTVNDALRYIKLTGLKDSAVKTISLAAGTYWEKVTIDMPNVRLIGTGTEASDAVIVFDALNGLLDPSGTTTYSTDGSATVTISKTAVGFYAENITIKNYYNTNDLYNESKLITNDTQAVAALVQADQSAFKNVRFTSYHDTLYAQIGRQYYENCYIEGRTDYIFGYNATAYFQNCQIHTIGAGVTEKNGGYVVATKGHSSSASTDAIKYGYIFNECTFDADDNTQDGSVSIARGWDVSMAVIVMNSEISAAFSKTAYGDTTTGLNNRYTKMNAAPVASQLLEYNNTGDGAITESLADTCTVTTEDIANEYANLFTVFGTVNGLVKYTEAWAGLETKNASITLKDSAGNVIAELTNISYIGSTVTETQLINSFELSEDVILEGFFTDASYGTKFDFTTQLTESTEIYVKYASAENVPATTINFNSITASVTTETPIDNTGLVTLIATSSKSFSFDSSVKEITDADGTAYTPTVRLKTGGASDATGRYIKIDLSKFGGYAKIQIWSQTGSGSADRTGQLRKGAVDGTSVLVVNCPSGSAATLNEVVVECGTVYYLTADASINYFGINIIPDTAIRSNKTWSFRTDSGDNLFTETVQNTTLEQDGLFIDATTGKFAPRAQQWAQFNSSTSISFKVAAGASVTIAAYESKYTVNGTAAVNATTVYTATEDTTITIVATDNTYIDYISVEFA